MGLHCPGEMRVGRKEPQIAANGKTPQSFDSCPTNVPLRRKYNQYYLKHTIGIDHGYISMKLRLHTAITASKKSETGYQAYDTNVTRCFIIAKLWVSSMIVVFLKDRCGRDEKQAGPRGSYWKSADVALSYPTSIRMSCKCLIDSSPLSRGDDYIRNPLAT